MAGIEDAVDLEGILGSRDEVGKSCAESYVVGTPGPNGLSNDNAQRSVKACSLVA